MSFDRWGALLERLTQRIWFRLVVFAALAVALILAGPFVGPLLPSPLAFDFGQGSVETILRILASSMLAVTTFSLTALISSYASASAGTTPRATQLLISDRTSHNALSTFLGSFVFAIVGIIALSTSYYGEEGRTLLFVGTIVVIAVVVGTLLRWIQHLTGFGRMGDVLDRVERAASESVSRHAERPRLGGAAATEVPERAAPVRAQEAGCVTGVVVEELSRVAEHASVAVHVAALPGAVVGVDSPLAYVDGDVDDAALSDIRKAFRIERHRTFEQDPRLGFVALSEIGSRALSPATNDPGTAIEALNAIQRVMAIQLTAEPTDAVKFPRVHVPTLAFEEFVEGALRPIARDGAPLVEVGLRMQRVIGHLVDIASREEAEVLRRASSRAEERALAKLDDDHERRQLIEAAQRARKRR